MTMHQTQPRLSSLPIISTIIHDYLERLHGHLDDGYVVRHHYTGSDFYQVRLRHMANGNEIIIKADFREYYVEQKTNHLVTFRKDYDPNI